MLQTVARHMLGTKKYDPHPTPSPQRGMRKLLLSNGITTLIDDSDFERVSQYKWSSYKFRKTSATPYVVRYSYKNGKQSTVYLHRFLMDAPKGMQVDHKNGDGLDNRRSNLRICTNEENQQNQRVHREGHLLGTRKGPSGWTAQIWISGKVHYIGHYKTKEIAHQRYLDYKKSLIASIETV